MLGSAPGTDSACALRGTRVRRYLDWGFISGPAPRYICGLTFTGLGLSAALVERKWAPSWRRARDHWAQRADGWAAYSSEQVA